MFIVNEDTDKENNKASNPNCGNRKAAMTDDSNTTTKPYGMVICPLREIYIATFDTSVPYFVNAALNVPLAIATTFANLLVLLAMRHVKSIRLPSKLLLCSLVLTDLGTGLVVQPQFVAFLFMRRTNPNPALCSLAFSLNFNASVFTSASLSTLTAICADRYAALFFHLKYQQIVTTRRVCAVLAFIWSFSLFYATTSLWSVLVWLCLSIVGIIITFPAMSVVCIKIYRRLRAQQVQPEAPDQAQQQAGNTLDMERYRRTASAMMLVYVLFVICFIPHFFAVFVMVFRNTALRRCIREFAFTFVLLNSCLNPFVYCLRLPEIRTEVMKLLRKLSYQTSQ